jgi:adenylate kinase
LADHTAISVLFSQFGGNARTKLLILGSSGAPLETLMIRARSLNIEHVSLADLMRQEISRRTPFGLKAEKALRGGTSPAEESIVALLRRWFWARKPDAGFALTGFPATLLQAKIFDEWLDARGESLDAVCVPVGETASAVSEHYRILGQLCPVSLTAA